VRIPEIAAPTPAIATVPALPDELLDYAIQSRDGDARLAAVRRAPRHPLARPWYLVEADQRAAALPALR
jgi:hypothetical protein